MVMFGEGPDGKATKSNELKLENSHNNFERASVRKLYSNSLPTLVGPCRLHCSLPCDQVDTFEVEATIGDLKYIRIGHDNTGPGPGWHLQVIKLQSSTLHGTPFDADVKHCHLSTFSLIFSLCLSGGHDLLPRDP